VSIENVLERMGTAGYRLSNLFQRADGQWQANVIDPAGKSHEFGTGPTPVHALVLAMSNAKHEVQWFGVMQAMDRALEARRE